MLKKYPSSIRLKAHILANVVGNHALLSNPSAGTRMPLATHVDSLPVEVLSEIFAYTLPHPPELSPRFSPLVLTHVSRHWRHVTLSTTSLWSAVFVSQKHVKLDGLMSMIQLWLQRSGSHPLHVSVDLFDGNDTIMRVDDFVRHRKIYRSLASMLLPHLHRLEVLYGHLPPSMASAWKFDAMVKMKELVMCGVTEMSLGSPKPLPGFHRIPGLDKLSIQNFGYSFESVLMQSHITHLELMDLNAPGQLSPARVMELLQSLPLLRVCALALTVPSSQTHLERDDDVIQIPAYLTQLECLYLEWEDGVDIDEVILHISTPRLGRLCLNGTPRSNTPSWKTLHTYLVNSRPPVTYLSLNCTADVDIMLVDCLKLCPNLQSLRLNHCSVVSPLLAALAQEVRLDSQQDILMPHIRCLHLGACHDFNSSGLRDCLLNRCSGLSSASEGSLRLAEFLYCNGLYRDYCDGALADIYPANETACDNLTLIIDNGNSFPAPMGMGILPFVSLAESFRDFLSYACPL